MLIESFVTIYVIQNVAVLKLKFLSGISNLSASFSYGWILKGKPQLDGKFDVSCFLVGKSVLSHNIEG